MDSLLIIVNGLEQRAPLKTSGALKSKLPFDQWPMWAKGMKLLSTPEDKGVGDVIARIVGAEKSETFKAWFKAIFGKDCGCNGRQAELNLKYPL